VSSKGCLSSKQGKLSTMIFTRAAAEPLACSMQVMKLPLNRCIVLAIWSQTGRKRPTS